MKQMCHNKFWVEKCVHSWYENAQEGLPLTMQTQKLLRKAGAGSAKPRQEKE